MQDIGRNSNKDFNMDNDMNNNANNNVNEPPLSDDKRLREMYDKLVGYEKTILDPDDRGHGSLNSFLPPRPLPSSGPSRVSAARASQVRDQGPGEVAGLRSMDSMIRPGRRRRGR